MIPSEFNQDVTARHRVLREALMRAEFPTSHDVGVFMYHAGTPKENIARFPQGLPKQRGKVWVIEFLASKAKAKRISQLARENNGMLVAM